MKTTASITLAILALTAALPSRAGSTNPSLRENTNEDMAPAAVVTRVKTALNNAKDVDAREIKVATYRDTIQLSGYVGTINEKSRAEEVAKSVPGVRDVENRITVK